MTKLSLTADDLQEMLSSLFMADMPYNARMEYSHGASLVSDFQPTKALLPKLETVTETVRSMFNVSLKSLNETTTLKEWAETLHNEWEETDGHITFFTSGSTGTPKATTHDITLHEQEVCALAEIFAGRRRIISFVPRHHIYGFLFSILLPKALQVPVRWEAPLPTPGLISQLQPDDLVVAFPLLWGKLVELEVKFGSGISGVTSTGPCPATTIEVLCDNGLERMYEIYGSSETGGVGYRTSPTSGYTMLPYWSQTDALSSLQRENPTLGRQEYTLQDVFQWQNDTFTPARRTDDGVQVAGINVYPSHVRDILLECPDIKDCAVRLMREEEGDRLKTLIIPNGMHNEKELESTIRGWAKTRLSPYELPSAWTIAKKIPTNAMGKPKDW